MSIDQSRPAYRVLAVSGFFGPDDNLYELDNEIYFDGEPNEELEPLNDAARLKMIQYLDKLDELGRKAAEKVGRAYAGRPRNIDGAIELATAVARANMSVMGVKKDEQTVERVQRDEAPEVGSVNPKRGRGRPKGSMSISSAA